MFDFSVWELVVIGGVALVVIGPERLPRVARTAGHLLGRFQRYVADVKQDINREIELSELKKLQSSVQDAARDIEQTVKQGVTDAEKQLKEAEGDIKSAGDELRKAGEQISSGYTAPHMGTAVPAPEPVAIEATPDTGYDPRAAALNPGMAEAYALAKPKAEAPRLAGAEGDDASPQLELGLPRSDSHGKPG